MAAKISKNCLATMYEDIQKNYIPDPVLQILAYEQAQYDPKSEIIVRLSDSVTFLDCTLLGSYCLENGKIYSKESNRSPVQFKVYDIVRLEDCFSKIDSRKMCKLRIIVRKMELVEVRNEKIGFPAELSQFIQNKSETGFDSNGQILRHGTQDVRRDNKELIKIEEEEIERIIQKREETIERKNQNQPLTYREIIKKKDGFFIGRLLRIKLVSKDTKEGIMSVLYLGFIDRAGEMVRINMAGRTAIKEAKELKKNKCYFIKGLEVFQTQKMNHPQIRLKDKDSKIMEVQPEKIAQQFASQYYHWDHENDSVDNENVDVIGIIDEIEEKTSYTQTNSQDNREVVRIVIRNRFKNVKVSFWAEQIKSLQALNLRKKQPILLEDIKKKKNMFLDFTFESSATKLDEQRQLFLKFQNLLPIPEKKEQPNNIIQLNEIYLEEPSNNKVRTLKVFLTRLHDNRIIYRLCQKCKKKVQKYVDECPDCQSITFYHKYNCQMQFADSTGSLNCVAFEYTAQKLFNKTAGQMSDLSSQEMIHLIENCLFRQYIIGIENKNLRLIVRNIDAIEHFEMIQQIQENLDQIRKMIDKRE